MRSELWEGLNAHFTFNLTAESKLNEKGQKKEKQKGKTQQQKGGVKNQAWCTKMFRVFFSKFKLKPIRFWLFSIFCFSVVRKITKLREESGSDDETRIKWWIYIYKWFSQPSLSHSLTHFYNVCLFFECKFLLVLVLLQFHLNLDTILNFTILWTRRTTTNSAVL